MTSNRSAFIAGIILVAATALAIASSWNDSPIVDEVPHIGAGYTYIVRQAYLFNPEHPPLAKDTAGLALLTLPINQSLYDQTYQGNWPSDVNGQWNFGRALIFQSGVSPLTIVRVARLPMLLFFLIAGWFIFLWARRLYSPRAGLFALALFAFSPTIIAHARLVTTDVTALFGIVLSTYFLLRYFRQPTAGSFWLAAIMIGLAQLTKFSTFLLLPYFVIIALIWDYAHRTAGRTTFRTLLAIIVGFAVIVGPIYQFHILHYSAAAQKSDTHVILGGLSHRSIAAAIEWGADKPVLRPFAEYALGLAMVFQRAVGGNQTYFLGTVSSQSFTAYFPVVYALKEPIPLLGLLLLAIITALFLKKNGQTGRGWLKDHFEEVALLLWVLFYWAVSIDANLNIGIRHLIPVYGFTFILIAGQMDKVWNLRKPRGFDVLVRILFIWYLMEGVLAFPYYLTYFNEFAGGPTGGHRYVVDSNLDWGQDAKRLGDWVKTNNIHAIDVDYFGWADPAYYLGKAYRWTTGDQSSSRRQFLARNPAGGYLAVSGTYYQESIASNGNHNYSWLQNLAPATVVGNSIFVWHVTP